MIKCKITYLQRKDNTIHIESINGKNMIDCINNLEVSKAWAIKCLSCEEILPKVYSQEQFTEDIKTMLRSHSLDVCITPTFLATLKLYISTDTKSSNAMFYKMHDDIQIIRFKLKSKNF